MAECRAGNRRVPDPGKAGTRTVQSEGLNGRAVRRGTAMLLLTAGDKEISNALADGIMAVRLPMANSLSHAARASSLGEGAFWCESAPFRNCSEIN